MAIAAATCLNLSEGLIDPEGTQFKLQLFQCDLITD